MEIINSIMQLWQNSDKLALSLAGILLLQMGQTITKINLSLFKRKQNKNRNLKLYKMSTPLNARFEQDFFDILKYFNLKEYLEYIDNSEFPEEFKEIIKTFVKNVDQENLRLCIRNLNTIKLNKKSIIKDFKEYLNSFLSSLIVAGKYYPQENSIDIYFPSKQVLSHEFIHMCTNNKANCGFNLDTPFNEEIGLGLNEGYTELLNQRIFKYKHCAYSKNVGIVKLLETFFDNPKDLEDAFFHNDLDKVTLQFCKYGTKEEFFNLLENLDNFAAGPIPLKDFTQYHKLQFELYEIIKRSNDPIKIQNFENILFQNPLNKILKNGFHLEPLNQTSKRLK